MARESQSDSEDSVISHITVHVPDSPAQPTANMSTASRSSVGASSLSSTPPTSANGSTEGQDASNKSNNRRVSRSRSSLSTLASEAADASTKRKATRSKEDMQSKATSRAVSGVTLVEGGNNTSAAQEKLLKQLDIDMHFDAAEDASHLLEDDNSKARRRSSRQSHIGTSPITTSTTSSLGKRARDMIDTVKDKASSFTTRTTRFQAPQSPPKRAKHDEGPRRMFPNLPRTGRKGEKKEEEEVAEPAGRIASPKPTKPTRIEKVYQTKGLYAGQTRSFDDIVKVGTNKKKHAQIASNEAEKENSILPLPMFGTYKCLNHPEPEAFLPFKLPADVLVPLRKEQVPKNWNKLNKNRFIGDATATWNTKDFKKLARDLCKCIDGKCGDNCYNRLLSYECNENICGNKADCGNRPFAELKWRYANKNETRLNPGEKLEGNLWGQGIETVDTKSRGFGVRAMRPFAPNQIIVEYCGEIITQEEADRRMNEDYKDKKVEDLETQKE
jgi:palmitoyltransferase ZDHHC9/14/18